MINATFESFQHTWSARVLTQPPLIAPMRKFTYPVHVPGEEDAIARGALIAEIKPATGGTFLATCALGYKDPSLTSGIFSCPRPDDVLFLAGGYAYLVDTLHPETCLHIPLRPILEIYIAPEQNLILLGGINRVEAIGVTGLAWQSKRLSWEGITLERIENNTLHGVGWDMMNNRNIPFELNLQTGRHVGGGYEP